MADVVLDASAVLALLNGEAGAEEVWEQLPGAYLSAVNAAEVAAKLVDRGVPAADAGRTLEGLGTRVLPFGLADVVPAARIREASRAAALSLGDRSCLALAMRLGVPALTADRIWSKVDTGVDIRQIR